MLHLQLSHSPSRVSRIVASVEDLDPGASYTVALDLGERAEVVTIADEIEYLVF